ncbi:hypothetical protein MQX03_01500 [Chryseobacterium aahli]|uniref:hypothetical protein n=1 Tax=Chryseobacterium aahli TaxID=1278643 RepID=UPI001F611E2A|nr:hypothetical protein [Chryseobacterium aahli]MCI3935857.1 hypothetical protein [Chryseobacterium aahli]
MKYFSFLLIILFCFSCSKSLEEKCFIQENEKYFNGPESEEPLNIDQIIQNKPDYLQIVNLKKFRSFKKDSTDYSENFKTYQADEKYLNDQKILFADFDEKFFGQFRYSSQQISDKISYALGENALGYWLLEIKNNNPRAYFLGLSYSYYYFNKVQDGRIVKDGFLQIEGSFVKTASNFALRGREFTSIGDGKLFKIKLDDLTKDSDQDSFNDIFENSFGLNPNSKDTDEDGIDDFNDHNPLFKSEKNKFTELYEDLISQHLGIVKENLDKMPYFFLPYETDCDYFKNINPDAKILIMPTEKSRQPYYVQVTDIFNGGYSKIKKDDKNPNLFYIHESGGGGIIDYSAEFKNGVWILKNIGGVVS